MRRRPPVLREEARQHEVAQRDRADARRRLEAVVRQALAGEQSRQLAETSLIPAGDTPQAFQAFIHQDAQNDARLVKAANIAPK